MVIKEEESGEKVFSAEDREIVLKVMQKRAAEKQSRRTHSMGDLLRSKGFVWIATTNNIMGGWQQVRYFFFGQSLSYLIWMEEYCNN